MIAAVTALVFCTVSDDAGRTIQVSKPAQRIVSLAPDVTETLFAAGAGSHVVGVVSGSDYPAAAKKIPQVGSYSGIDLEKIISLHPDLVVTWGKIFPRQVAVLKRMGITIYTAQPCHLEDIPRTIKNIGCLAGTEKQAQQAAESFSRQLGSLRQAYHLQKPITVFYQIGNYSLITVNKESWINQVIELCGGRNVFVQAKTVAPEVSWEAVVTANPQVIISDVINENWKDRWQRWPMIDAVKKQQLFSIQPDLIDRAGPRLLEGTAQMCKALQMAQHCHPAKH